ncbi:unnamed protein product [Brassica napus]|uniref:(rape) hypothetical protein n=2 Tax=Brassica napus TaxID=3708 RepID=A0A816MLV5_BRANA|nr:unnamed protein product [Brassica napus]
MKGQKVFYNGRKWRITFMSVFYALCFHMMDVLSSSFTYAIKETARGRRKTHNTQSTIQQRVESESSIVSYFVF